MRPSMLDRAVATGILLVGVGVGIGAGAGEPGAPDDPSAVAGGLVGAAMVDGRAHHKLTYLTDRVGHRLSGSHALERAVAWAAAEFERDGLDRVWTEKVRVPHWVRGEARARIVAPIERDLPVLALGGSVATPPDGTTAEVIEVASFDQLEAAAGAVAGKLVLFNRAMEAGWNAESGYGSLAPLRVDGPSRAARLGAVGMLIRSLGTANYRLPHTGALAYDESVPRIPAAALAAEDAELLHRLIGSGETVRVRLDLGCSTLDDAESANVLAEIPGRERPDEIVLIGAHLDSWDVGHGAHDDGAGCAIVMETMRLLRRLAAPPRRTVRAVLFTNEENGLRGGLDYAERHGAERHVAAIESDSGGFRPVGFGVTAGEGGVEMVREIARRLATIGAADVVSGGGGADIGPLRKRHGVPVIGLRQDGERYFDYHHTEADTLDKVDPGDLDRNVAALAVVTYLLAEQDAVLPRLQPEP